MRLSTDILYESLAQHMQVKRYGTDISDLSLRPPVFADHDTIYEQDGVYLGYIDTMQTPESKTECLLICLGDSLPPHWAKRKASVFLIHKNADLFAVFNVLQSTFGQFGIWDDKLRRILDESASIAEMVKVTAPILENPISLCNSRLEIEAISDPSGNVDYAALGPVAEKYVGQFLDRHNLNTAMREPFGYEIDGYATYCINIYKQNTYLGLVTIGSSNRPFKQGDFKLFEHFASFVQRAVERRQNAISGQFVTLKSVLFDLIDGMSVDPALVRKALHKEAPDGDIRWVCAAAMPGKEADQLPVEYVCALMESSIAQGIAMPYEGFIVVFFPVEREDSETVASYDDLEQALIRQTMQAGVSPTFTDIEQAKDRFLQAKNAYLLSPLTANTGPVYRFDDCLLLFSLRNSVGELDPTHIVPESMLALREKRDRPGSVDYWNTLKIYLDNEMNLAQTACDLSIHRTTLQARLKKIRDLVSLSTPSERLLARYCIYLYDAFFSL